MSSETAHDQPCLKIEPTSEHAWLKRMLGDWTYEHVCPTEPGAEPMRLRGRETVRALGDLWIHGEARGEMPGGGEAHMVLTVGFDPGRGRFVGTWVGSMMTHLWIYEGWLEGDNTLILEATGPRWDQSGKTARFRDITEFKGPNQRAFRAMMQQEDGSWHQIMSATYHRVP
jgi:hypothetical protein